MGSAGMGRPGAERSQGEHHRTTAVRAVELRMVGRAILELGGGRGVRAELADAGGGLERLDEGVRFGWLASELALEGRDLGGAGGPDASGRPSDPAEEATTIEGRHCAPPVKASWW